MSIESYQTKAGLRYRVRYRDLSHRQRSIPDLPSKKAAQAEEAKLRAAVQSRTLVNAADGRVTMETLGELFLASHGRKAATMARYESAWNARVRAKWGTVPVGRVRMSDITLWIAELRDDGILPDSINSALDVLAGIFHLAVADQLISHNPMLGVKRAPKAKPRRNKLSHAQIAALAAEIGKGYRPYAIVVLTLAYSAMRIGELSALRVRDWDRSAMLLSVVEGATVVKGHRIIDTPKDGESRSIDVPAFLAPLLDEMTRNKLPDAWLFVGPMGGTINVQNFRTRPWKKALATVRAADPTFPVVTPHDLRGSAATNALAAFATIKDVQNMLGHSRATTTLDDYAARLPNGGRDVAKRLNDARIAAVGD